MQGSHQDLAQVKPAVAQAPALQRQDPALEETLRLYLVPQVVVLGVRKAVGQHLALLAVQGYHQGQALGYLQAKPAAPQAPQRQDQAVATAHLHLAAQAAVQVLLLEAHKAAAQPLVEQLVVQATPQVVLLAAHKIVAQHQVERLVLAARLGLLVAAPKAVVPRRPVEQPTVLDLLLVVAQPALLVKQMVQQDQALPRQGQAAVVEVL